jgi:hypothetical protein
LQKIGWRIAPVPGMARHIGWLRKCLFSKYQFSQARTAENVFFAFMHNHEYALFTQQGFTANPALGCVCTLFFGNPGILKHL